MRQSATLKNFRKIATIEGISMIVLLVFSVLKRISENEIGALGVKYVGWLHGVLFVIYVYALIRCWLQFKWSWKRVALFFIASFLPFAPFWVEKRLKTEELDPAVA
ncbi:MAG TPA: DUF3817 domain-containing protein [Edaphocola sp.]|nr:DUF3817 domain-containing protein [Edaphocola sp.]